MMHRYAVAGIHLVAPLPLAELHAAGGEPTPADWTVELVAGPPQPDEPGLEVLTEQHNADGSLWCTVAAGPDGTYRLRYPSVGLEARIDPSERRVALVARPDLPEPTRGHLLIDQVVPHLVALDGGLVLHASAVVLDGVAVGFVAPSGYGKSSLAAAFVQTGGTLLADDYLLLEPRDAGYRATSAYPGLRLWDDSATHFGGDAAGLPAVAHYTDKRRLAVPAEPVPEVPLGALVVIGRPARPDEPVCRIEPTAGQRSFIHVYQQVFRLERAGRARQAEDLDRISRLVTAVPVLQVQHRRDYDVLPEVVATIRAALARHVGSAA